MVDLSKATPRPWHGDPQDYAEFIWGPNNEMIAQMRGAGRGLDQVGHRDLILEAVNSHEKATMLAEAVLTTEGVYLKAGKVELETAQWHALRDKAVEFQKARGN